MRARYGVDPEALGLAGPNAFASAFDASLRGMELGENMATSALNREIARERLADTLETNALNRELARERAEQVRQDRLAEATLSTPVTVGGAGAASGGGGKSGSKSSGAAAVSVPMTMQQFVRQQVDASRQPVAKLRTIGDAASIWGGAGLQPAAEGIVFGESEDEGPAMTAEELATMRDRMGVPEPSRVVDVPLRNPLIEIGFREEMVPTPVQARVAIFRDPTLSDSRKRALVRDYENFYAQRAGQYQDTMSAMMQAQADAAAEAAELRNAQITRGLAVVQMLDDAERRNLPFPELTPEQKEDRAVALQYAREAYQVPSGQMTDIRKSEISNAAAQMNAALSRAKFKEQQEALRRARGVRYQEGYVDAKREWLKANNVTDESTLSPDAAADMEAYADQIGKREAAKVVNIPTAKEMFTGGADSGGPEPMTFEQARAAIALRADQKGYTYSKEGLDFAADQALKDPKAIASLRRGLADPATQRQVQPWEAYLQGGGGRIVQPPREPTEAQINAAKEAVEETGEVFDRDAYIDSYRRMTGSPGASG